MIKLATGPQKQQIGEKLPEFEEKITSLKTNKIKYEKEKIFFLPFPLYELLRAFLQTLRFAFF